MKNVLLLLRPHQWLKNCFVFLPLFFDRHLFDAMYITSGLLVFFAFCFAASSIYCFNDIIDVESDRKHPKKCNRPIACGAISKEEGMILMIVCVLISLGFVALIDNSSANQTILYSIVGCYIVLNITYCISLKNKPVIDVFVIAIGFVLRIMAGGYACGIWLSEWIILMTFLLALFLAFAKRRDDVVLYAKTGMSVRKSTIKYNLPFMNVALGIFASVTLVCYIMYTVSPEVTNRFDCNNVYLTSLFVLAGIIRYLQITMVELKSGSPTKVLIKDRFIQLCVVGWLLTFALIIYV